MSVHSTGRGGAFGAKHFDASLLQSRRVIGLDAGAEGVFRMGTSTKFEMTSLYPAHREKVHGVAYRLIVDGLKGGRPGSRDSAGADLRDQNDGPVSFTI